MKTNKLSCKDLMIGDWVEYNGKYIQVENVHKDMINYTPDIPYVQEEYFIDGKDISPIPLTAEILEKNGFVENGINVNYHYLAIGDFEVYIYYSKNNTQLIIEKRYGTRILNILNIAYVHKLQHALRQCGIDKEIKLED